MEWDNKGDGISLTSTFNELIIFKRPWLALAMILETGINYMNCRGVVWNPPLSCFRQGDGMMGLDSGLNSARRPTVCVYCRG